ncbi:hypothetical protein VTK73DRAFT_2422 [Phialemonium thermophilum]|uniref:Uncharacterized protein n=1 Tax=Phialemonium thermophilum TaxID=223376 RepID=A0ABR3VS45_9PEZI
MEQAFRLAFARIGEIFFAADDESTLFLILGAHLLMSEAYPIAALRLIQAAGDRLGRCGKRQVNEPWWIERFQDCLKLHHVIESDILLTTDGLPSDAAFSLMNGLPAMRSLREAETGYSNLSVAEIARKKFGETLLEDVLALATLQNRILAQMYTIEQAYSQPSVLARSVTELKAELTHWFDDLPLEWHFPRDLSGAMTIPTPEPDMLAHLRLKYYVLEFLMCRPILYYIAHESFEARLDHASVSTDGSTESEGRPFWVYDACHRCLQCAALMILGSDTRWPPQEHAAPRKDWFELHMIWGAALTLALALATPALTRFLPKHGQAMDASMLLAKAEAILLRAAEANCVPAQCLAILCDVEQHLLGGTPGLVHASLSPAQGPSS